MNQDTKKPLNKYKMGQYSLTAWENDTNKGKFINWTLQRSYTTDDGKTWQNQNISGIRPGDLAKLSAMLLEVCQKTTVTEQ